MLSTPDLLSRAHYGDLLVSVPQALQIPNDLPPEPNERLGRYFERLVGHGIASLNPVLHHSRLQIIQDKKTLGELDMVFQLPNDPVTHHWELAIKYYLRQGDHFVGLRRRDRLDLKLHKLFDQQLRLSGHPITRERLAALGYPSTIRSQAWVKGMLFYPWGTTPAFPSEVAPHHARGVWSVGFPQEYTNEHTAWVLLPKLTWLRSYRSPAPALLTGEEAARLTQTQDDLMFARVEPDGAEWVERERLCVVGPEWL